MHVTTKAIVLSKLKYKDYDLIVKCYTEAFGIQSYLLRNIFKTKKGKLKPAYFQLFSLLELEADHKPNRSLQYIKEVKRYEVTTTIDTDIIKTTIVLFLSEILTSVITEEEPHSELYQYLETSIKWFDVHETYSNFHLIFLIELTKYLGFYPEITDTNTTYFDLEQGKFLQSFSTGIGKGVNAIDFNEKVEVLLAGGPGGVVEAWDYRQREKAGRIEVFKGSENQTVSDPRGATGARS